MGKAILLGFFRGLPVKNRVRKGEIYHNEPVIPGFVSVFSTQALTHARIGWGGN